MPKATTIKPANTCDNIRNLTFNSLISFIIPTTKTIVAAIITGNKIDTYRQFNKDPKRKPRYIATPPNNGVATLCIFLPPGKSKILNLKASFLSKGQEKKVSKKHAKKAKPDIILFPLTGVTP